MIEERVRTGSRPGQRTDGLRVALSIEGGGMRGTVSAGMALALHERGLMSAFDAVYGSSAGAITGAWLLSSEPARLHGWAHPDYARTMIRWSALLHRRPVADVRTLVEVLYQTEFPMDFHSILASPIEFHPLATDAATGESTDLRPMISNPAELRLAMRASAALPLLAGPRCGSAAAGTTTRAWRSRSRSAPRSRREPRTSWSSAPAARPTSRTGRQQPTAKRESMPWPE